MSPRSLISIVAASLLALLAFSTLPVLGDPAADGDSWEVTSKMSMEGVPMDMPAQTSRVCTRRDEAPTENRDPSCRNSEMTRVGSKITWRIECANSKGRGELVYSSPDAYTGSLRFESPEGVMILTLSGKRVGSCQAPG
jgi:Protein of unknown function (DUF3617)